VKQEIKVRVSPLESSGLDLLEIFEVLQPITFARLPGGRADDAGGIVFEATLPKSSRADGAERLEFACPATQSDPASTGLTEMPVMFSDLPAVPFPFRGRKLNVRLPSGTAGLSPMPGELALATTAGGPIWVAGARNGVGWHRSSLPLPSLAIDGMLQQVLNADRFLELLPWLEFLRQAGGDGNFAPPPLRACFMVDDPNLHWPRYGFVDYRELAVRAARENYHVSFATVPLDGWYTHPGAAHLFQNNPRQLSLLVHGNDHTHYELARERTAEQCLDLLRQAGDRVERLERAVGCEISRVMAAPHGACSEAMLQAMPACGFESAVISHGSLRAHNQGKPWTRRLGYLPSEIIQGCPVLPRWGVTGNTHNTILLAAYLGQPIILRGHHADLRDDAELLGRLANLINGLGPVTWGNMTELSRMNYQMRLEADTLRIRPGGLKLNVPLPAGARQMVIEAPSAATWNKWVWTGASAGQRQLNSGEVVDLPRGCEKIFLAAVVAPAASSVNGHHGLPLWPLLRRLLTEGRDRLQPMAG